jgi:N-acetylglutamate synthase-like GNAT family acetyltransferase
MSEAARVLGADRFELRPVGSADIPALADFIAAYTGDGTLLPRTRANLLAHRDEFLVLSDRDELAGCGALQIVDAHLAEIRSLAVRPDLRGHGLGGRLLDALMARAQARHIHRVFCLTRKVEFFAHHQFDIVAKENFPHKIWSDCRLCPRRLHCDEVAMQRILHVPARRHAVPASRRGVRLQGTDSDTVGGTPP